jgi:toxin ParE1/3/4
MSFSCFFTCSAPSPNWSDPVAAVDDIRAGYRRSVCGADSIYYRVQGDTVEILAIVGQQDLDNWL